MPEEPFDLGVVNRFILYKQHLDGRRPGTGIADVAGHIGGLHNTGPSTPYLSLFARMPGFTRDMLDEEMYVQKNLVRIRCMRNTMHVLPRDLISAAFTSTSQSVLPNAGRFLEYRGVSDEEYDVVSGKVVSLLQDGGKTTAEIKRDVGPVTNLPAVLTLLCDRGYPGARGNVELAVERVYLSPVRGIFAGPDD